MTSFLFSALTCLILSHLQINSLMILLMTKKNAGYLKEGGCDHRLIKLFVVKWSGIFMMLQRYILMRPFLNVGVWVHMIPVLTLLPSPVEHVQILEIFEDLKKFEELSKMLQKDNGSLADARSGCDWLREKYPVTDPKLGPDFCDILHRDFESAVTMVQGNKEAQLTQDERVALEPFLVDNVIVVEEVDEADESLQGALKRARVAPIAAVSNYICLLFILASTNIVERLFSITRKIWTEDRKRMTPASLEMMMFLKISMKLWDSKLVYKIRHDPRPRGITKSRRGGI